MKGMAMTLRPELNVKELPIRMAELPVHRGYPVPWFVDWVDGEPEFRLMDGRKWNRAVKEKLCWVCGQRLGAYLCFVLGPMCGITRTTAEPPSHRECALWSAKNCPFLSRPRMERRDATALEEAGAKSLGGCAIRRNPGVSLLWITRTYKIWRPAPGELLIRVDDPLEVEWWFEGREATCAEIEHSIETGLPALLEIAAKQDAEEKGAGAVTELERQIRNFRCLLK